MRVSRARSPDVALLASHISSSAIYLAFIPKVDDAIFLHIVIYFLFIQFTLYIN